MDSVQHKSFVTYLALTQTFQNQPNNLAICSNRGQHCHVQLHHKACHINGKEWTQETCLTSSLVDLSCL